MENLDLSKLTPEQVSKIMEIVNENKSDNRTGYESIKEEFLKQNENVKKSEEYEGIAFDEYYGKATYVDLGKTNAKKNEADKVTYSQLRTIHSHGTPKNFMAAIKEVISAKREIDISEVGGELDEETRNLLNGK